MPWVITYNPFPRALEGFVHPGSILCEFWPILKEMAISIF